MPKHLLSTGRPTTTNRVRRAVLPSAVTLLAGCAFAAVPSNASAAPTWLEARTLSAAGQFSPTLRVQLPADGSAVATWTRGPFDAALDQTPTGLEGAVRTPGSSALVDPWPSPSIVAESEVVDIELAATANGDTFGAFARNGVVRLVRRSAGSATFTDLGPISDGQVGISPVLRLSGNEHGDVVVAWHDARTRRVGARVRLADGTLGPVQELNGAGGTSNRVDAAIDGQGRATVVWSETSGSAQRVFAAATIGTGEFTAPVEVAPDHADRQTTPRIVAGSDGAVTVAFASRGALVAARRSAESTSFGPHQVLTGSAVLNSYDAVAFGLLADRHGGVVALWHGGTHNAPGGVYVARRPADATAFGAPTTVLEAGTHLVRTSSGAITPSGEVLVSWWQRAPGATTTAVAAAWIAPDGTVSTPFTVAEAEDLPGCSSSAGCPTLRSPQAAVAADGDAIVGWSREQPGGGWLTEVAGFDANGPEVVIEAAPETVPAGTAMTWAAAARDRWSGVQDLDWDLGDGTEARGSQVLHTYAEAGTYTARVTARDGVGNSTTVERTVVVTPATAAPGPDAGGGDGFAVPPNAFSPPTSDAPAIPGRPVVSRPRVGRVRLGRRALSFRVAAAGRYRVEVARRTRSGTKRARWLRVKHTTRRTRSAGAVRVALRRLPAGTYRVRIAPLARPASSRVIRTFVIRGR